MSLPPQYRRQIEDEESAPLYKGDERFSLDLESSQYPPRFGQSSTSNDEGQNNVNYTFAPRWPMKGQEEHALGVLGRTKEETTAMVQKRFTALASFPPERIEYLVPMQLDATNKVIDNKWGLVMDEAWPGFQRKPPAYLKVQVQDAPGDAQARERHEKKIMIIVMSSIFLGIPGAFGLFMLTTVWYFGGLDA